MCHLMSALGEGEGGIISPEGGEEEYFNIDLMQLPGGEGFEK